MDDLDELVWAAQRLSRQVKKRSSPSALNAWACVASPGHRMTYYSGFLACDENAAELASAASALARQGAVSLVQRRIGPEAFEYIAQKRAPVANAG